MIKFLDLHKQYVSIKSEIDAAIASVIAESAFIGGKYLNSFEEAFAQYQESQYCVGVGNGTDALEIALEALELPPGSEVIVPANSFIASSEAVTRSGHKVVFCDCDPDDYTISIESLEEKITPLTAAVMAVHMYGHPCDMDEILRVAKNNGLKVLEDCAQAHGAEYKGRRVGSIGDVGTFSFYPGKNLGAYGDGGAIVTNDSELSARCRMIANHGRVDKYDHIFEGRNSRLDGLQSAVLSVKLNHLDKWLGLRREFADLYRKELNGVKEIELPINRPWSLHAYHLFVIRTSKRDKLQGYLKDAGVDTGIHYPKALHTLGAYSGHPQYMESMCGNSYSGELLSLPIGEHLNDKEITDVSRLIKRFFNK